MPNIDPSTLGPPQYVDPSTLGAPDTSMFAAPPVVSSQSSIPSTFPIANAHWGLSTLDTTPEKLNYLQNQYSNVGGKNYKFGTNESGDIVWSPDQGKTWRQFDNFSNSPGLWEASHLGGQLTTAGGIAGGAIGTPFDVLSGPLGTTAGAMLGAGAVDVAKRALGKYVENNSTPVMNPMAIGTNIVDAGLGQAGGNIINVGFGAGFGDELPSLSDQFSFNPTRQYTPQEMLGGFGKIPQAWGEFTGSALNNSMQSNNASYLKSLLQGPNGLSAATSPVENPNLYMSSVPELNQALRSQILTQDAANKDVFNELYGDVQDSASQIPYTQGQKTALINDLSNVNLVNDAASAKQAKLIKSLTNADINNAGDLVAFKQSNQYGKFITDTDPQVTNELGQINEIFDGHLNNSLSSDADALDTLQLANDAYHNQKTVIEPLVNAIKANKDDNGLNTVNMVRKMLDLRDLGGTIGLDEAQPYLETGLAQQLAQNPSLITKPGDRSVPFLNDLLKTPNGQLGPNTQAESILNNIGSVTSAPGALPGDLLPQNQVDALLALGKMGAKTANNFLTTPILAPAYNPGGFAGQTLMNNETPPLVEKIRSMLSPNSPTKKK